MLGHGLRGALILPAGLAWHCGGGVRGIEQTEVWAAGQDGYHTYRIPALITTPKGTLLAFCEGRKNNRQDHGDIDLLIKRSTNGGRTWSTQQVVHEEGGTLEITIGNPCPVIDQSSGTIWLPFNRDNDCVLMTKSVDDGLTWSPPVDISYDVRVAGWGWHAAGPGVGIQLRQGPRAGRLVIPCDHGERHNGSDAKHSHVFFSDDHGASWRLGGSLPMHTDECQVVELTDGTLLINMRNYWGRDGGQPENGGIRAVARSSDGGETWSEMEFDRTLVEPVCQASFLRYTWPEEQGRSRLLFSNPASSEQRVQMTVRLSYDEGGSWPIQRVLHSGPSAYSCLTVLPDLTIGCLYERGDQHTYEKITFARFTLDWLTEGQDTVD
jgi:sialidase-1